MPPHFVKERRQDFVIISDNFMYVPIDLEFSLVRVWNGSVFLTVITKKTLAFLELELLHQGLGTFFIYCLGEINNKKMRVLRKLNSSEDKTRQDVITVNHKKIGRKKN